MKKGGTRDGQWARETLAPVLQPITPALPPMSPDKEAAALSEGRAYAAMTTAAFAWRSADDRLNRYRRLRGAAAALSAAVGIGGIAGSSYLTAHAPDNPNLKLLLMALAVAAATAPVVACMTRITSGDNKESRMSTALECARMLIAQARRLGHAAATASGIDGLSPSARLPISMLLDDVEQGAAAAKGRENRLNGGKADAVLGRRHARIYPRHTRVVIVTGNNGRFNANIMDISVSGVGVEGALPGVGVGTDVVIGSRKGKVVRLLANGIGVEFATPIPETLLDRDIVL